MRVSIVNTLGKGGAFAACNRLRIGLLRRNHDVKLFTSSAFCDSLGECVNLKKVLKPRNPVSLKCRSILANMKYGVNRKSFLKSWPKQLEIFSFPETAFNFAPYLSGQKSDIVNFHWVTGLIDYNDLFRSISCPMVWTLHDMNPFSGGDHFFEEYDSIDRDGNLVPRKISTEEVRVKARIQKIKREGVAKIEVPLTVVSPSKWLAEEAENSEVFANHRIVTIPNGVESDSFDLIESEVAREALGVRDGKVNLVYVSENTKLMRKGGEVFSKALSFCRHKKNIRVLVMGWNDSFASHHDIEVEYFGFVNCNRLLNLVYSAGNATVVSSLQDNLPNTVLESFMCGRPVIGFKIGGIPDMIKHNENGMLSDEVNARSLAETIDRFIEKSEGFSATKIRSRAVELYDVCVQSEAYENLFHQIA